MPKFYNYTALILQQVRPLLAYLISDISNPKLSTISCPALLNLVLFF